MARPTARTSTSTSVRLTGAAATLLATGLLAACSASSGGSSPSTQIRTATDTTTATATATVTSSAAPDTHTSDPQTASGNRGSGNGGSGNETGAYCKESQLRASIDRTAVPGDGEHGRRAVIVDFRNTSDATCVLYGYPGAAVLNPSGEQVLQAKRTVRGPLLGYAPGRDTLVHVRLAPGDVAKAGIEGTTLLAQAGCDADPSPQIEVTPPNTKTAVPFDVSWPVCYSFTVHPVNYT